MYIPTLASNIPVVQKIEHNSHVIGRKTEGKLPDKSIEKNWLENKIISVLVKIKFDSKMTKDQPVLSA